ncbi:MAG: hypothetical protein LBD90_00805 [Bifidobacteriaceae bacterium]|jgi:alpha-galactosidase|nr:hypothetical protein [Bifidobacteriaceae bacterium]
MIIQCARLKVLAVTAAASLALIALPGAQDHAEAATTFDPTNALNRAPLMGWNSYNLLGGYWSNENEDCDLPSCIPLNETRVKAIAQALISTGLRDKGYVYVNIDDRWQDPRQPRDSNNVLQWDPRRFPSGIPDLADWLHERGLKLGIYALPNDRPCGGEEGPTDKPDWPSGLPETGSLGYEYLDAQTFAAWGVDYIKFDWCGVLESGTYGQAAESFELWNQAIALTGRPMLVAASTWGWENEWDWGPEFADTWRVHGDVGPYWTDILAALDAGSTPILRAASGPTRGWNDLDAIQAGNGSLSLAENRSHFIMWAVSNSPLILSNDLTSISPALLGIFSNDEIIAVNQDPRGEQARLISDNAGLQVWSRVLADGSRAVALLNRNDEAATITASLASLGVAGSPRLRDLVNHADLGTVTGSFNATVGARDTALIKVTPVSAQEAEDSELAGLAEIVACATCSNGAAVAGIGPDGEAEFDLYVAATGTYDLEIQYLNAAPDSSVDLDVNGVPAVTLTEFGVGSAGQLFRRIVAVDLHAGTNQVLVRGSAGTSPAPTIDCLTAIGYAPPVTVEFEVGTFSGGSFAVDCQNCSAGMAAGWIGGDTGEVRLSFLAAAAGQHIVEVFYRSGETRQVYVSVNGAAATVWPDLNSGGWEIVGSSAFTVTLGAGFNSLRFFVPGQDQWAPELDRAVITRV